MSKKIITMIRISSDRLQKSRDFHRNTFRKMRNYLQKEDCSPMLLPDAILQEDRWKIWYTKRSERWFWKSQKKKAV